MTVELDHLAQSLNRLIEQERFVEAQTLVPEYARELDRLLRAGGGEKVLKQAMDVFHDALTKARTARAHMAGELSDVNRARAYTGEVAEAESHSAWQFLA
jgi:hypothetical protein